MAETNTEEILNQEAEDAQETAAEENVETAEAEAVEPENAEAESASQDGSEKSSEKKGFFKKKKDKKDEQIEELNDRLKRNMAEFDNYRKRTEKEKAAMFEVGAKSVIEKILPVVDNFERGLSTVSDEEKETVPFIQGMDKTYKHLMKVLEDMEVAPIEAVGKEFDPVFHNAVMHVDDENVGDNIIVEEFQKGYTYRGSVVRFSMVKVAN